MSRRPIAWFVLSLVLFAASYYCWQLGDRINAERKARTGSHAAGKTAAAQKETLRLLSLSNHVSESTAKLGTDRKLDSLFKYRLSNTTQTVAQLTRSDKAILLENALVDTGVKTELAIPEHLKSKEAAGTYIVQCRGVITPAFRAALSAAGASIISYVPNNAYLVRASREAAAQLEGVAQAVLAYEPYYKLKPGLLRLAVEQQNLPEGATLNVLLFGDKAEATEQTMQDLGIQVQGRSQSPFGPELRVTVPADKLVALAQLPGVQELEAARRRIPANDLSRVTLGGAADSVTTTNYLDLSGSNVVVTVVDTGIDAHHADLENTDGTPRVYSDFDLGLVDTNGHGTFIAGIIAGNGSLSSSVTNAQGSVMPGTNGQFRGKAPLATLFSMTEGSDAYFQEAAASQTNALISNNSWTYGSESYDMAAANYDAAVRDSLPGRIGSKPMIYVFPSGNNGGANEWDNWGSDAGLDGSADSVQSPGTAKNVITVGAVEQARFITNEVWYPVDYDASGNPIYATNQVWMPQSDSDNQVAGFSGCGNVGVGVEGDFGRFKPDFVAPGSFLISTRSGQMDPVAYYSPTSHLVYSTELSEVGSGMSYVRQRYIPASALSMTVYVRTNSDSPATMPDLPVLISQSSVPNLANRVYDYIGTNSLTIPTNGTALSPVGTNWYYAVVNTSTQAVSFDVYCDLVVTNQYGNFMESLSNMNLSLGTTNYRYESGTSLSAAEISGMVALMQEFFEQRMHVTNSPALMKALLINGARKVNPMYDVTPSVAINRQGWGMPNLTNCIPVCWWGTNGEGTNNLNLSQGPSPTLIFDQSPTNSLATAQSHTRFFTLSGDAAYSPLRITLVWTDPAGSPVAGKKLVNNLDLVVTNLDTGSVYVGNDITGDNDYTSAWDTNSPANSDVVNNVENVFIQVPAGTNISVTIQGTSVNVNAVTEHTNDVVQDYALVISTDASLTNGVTMIGTNGLYEIVNSTNAANLTAITNMFPGLTNEITGGILEEQRAGANSPLIGTNTLGVYNASDLASAVAGDLTSGQTNQWHFYVITNTQGFTNAAFLTYDAVTLSIPRIGVREPSVDNATRSDADVDLYVSTNSALTNLDLDAISTAWKSLSRGGEETIVLSNALPIAYYIGVKCEDQTAAEYSILGAFSLLPFDDDGDGNHSLLAFPMPQAIPDGTVKNPGIATIFGIAVSPVKIHNVVITNIMTHELVGDLQETILHNKSRVVLNSHSGESGGVTNKMYVYDDYTPAVTNGLRTQGPGSLLDYYLQQGSGQWRYFVADTAPGHTGSNVFSSIYIERELGLSDWTTNTISAGSCLEAYVDVPEDATNLTIQTILLDGAGPVTITVCPADGGGCQYGEVDAANTNSFVVTDLDSIPPLNAGTYIVRFCNTGTEDATIAAKAWLYYDLNGANQIKWTSSGPVGIGDDAVTTDSIYVTNESKVVSVNVGLRVDHPRVSDLQFHLISPSGTRVLLCENRGGYSTNGMGTNLVTTTTINNSYAGGAAPVTNIIDTGMLGATNIVITYDFYQAPDTMLIQDGNGNTLYDSGFINGTGVITVNNSSSSSILVIIMNPNGNPDPYTAWDYTVNSSHAAYRYFTFTENTNYTETPVKFAATPFTMIPPGATNLFSDFETNRDGTPIAPKLYNGSVDNWTVNSGQVEVSDMAAKTGSNSLALYTGTISYALPTAGGRDYDLTFAYRLATLDGLVAWWRGDGNRLDSMGGAPLTFNNETYTSGEVGNALSFDGTGGYARADYDAARTDLGSFANGFTMEFWTGTNNAGSGPLLEWHDGTKAGLELSLTNGTVQFVLRDTAGGSNYLASAAALGTGTTNHHIAVTYSAGTGLAVLYVDGVSNVSAGFAANLEAATGPDYNLYLGGVPAPLGWYFNGFLDEVSLYSRPLSGAEIADIYSMQGLGKDALPTPPAVSPYENTATVLLNGTAVTNVTASLTEWRTNKISFTARSAGVALTLQPSGTNAAVLVDSFILVDKGGPYYVLPEVPMDSLKDQPAQGAWKLEVNDTRAGATEPAPVLQSWQLSFTFRNEPRITPLVHRATVTNTIPAGGVRYYSVGVPFWTPAVTNWLLSASSPVDVWFNQHYVPLGGNGGDTNLISNSTGDLILEEPAAATMTTNDPALVSGRPVLMSDATYYLCVSNRSALASTVALEADDWVTPLTYTNPVQWTNPDSTPRYFSYDVSSNETGIEVMLTNLSGNADLVISKTPFPSTNSYSYGSFNPWTEWEDIIFFTNSEPALLSAGTWYFGVYNRESVAVSYDIVVAQHTTNPVPNIGILYNGIAQYATNNSASGSNMLYQFTVPPNATAAQFELYNATGPMGLLVKKGLPLPNWDPPIYDYKSSNTNFSRQYIDVLTNSQPVPLTPGTWFLDAVNLTGTNVSYYIKATYWTTPVPTITELTNLVVYSATNNGSSGRGADYYHFVVTNPVVRAQFLVQHPSADVMLLVRRGLPLPEIWDYDYMSDNPGTNDELVSVYTNSLPVGLMPGDWYLSVVNMSRTNAAYTILASQYNDWFTNVTISTVSLTTNSSGSNVFRVSWYAYAGIAYLVEGKTSLSASNWVSISPTIVSPTDGITNWDVLLPSPYSFFQVVETVATDTVGIPAFPQAEGAGAYTRAGRYGSVYHVTNLLDAGTGSLRDAVSASGRTIVFDVSGTINLSSNLDINRSYLTIAGQSAPGDGITIKGYMTAVDYAHDVVLRYLRFRPGDGNGANFQGDAFQFGRAANVVADHVSASWSEDSALSVTNSDKVTVQWSVISESLNYSYNTNATQHGYGSRLRYGDGLVSLHHNLYAHNYSYNPRIGDDLTVDFVNNVVFNWGQRSGFSADDSLDNPDGFTNYLNYVANYLVAGGNTATSTVAFASGSTNTWLYQAGNLLDASYPSGALAGSTNLGTNIFQLPYTASASRFPIQAVDTDAANVGLERVLAGSGASLQRDSIDKRVVNDVRTKSGAVINSPSSVGGYATMISLSPYSDTNADGVPDFWAVTLGLSGTNDVTLHDRDGDGYTDLEEYLNWLGAPHAIAVTNTPLKLSLRSFVGGLTNLAFTLGTGTNGIPMPTNGTVSWYGTNGYVMVFTPVSNTNGYANFSFNATNADTGVSFGPVRVVVFISSLAVPATGSTSISSVSYSTNGVTLNWTALSSYSFQVQWADSLNLPIQWNTFPDIITSDNGSFSFTDDGSESGGLNPDGRFYRLIWIP